VCRRTLPYARCRLEGRLRLCSDNLFCAGHLGCSDCSSSQCSISMGPFEVSLYRKTMVLRGVTDLCNANFFFSNRPLSTVRAHLGLLMDAHGCSDAQKVVSTPRSCYRAVAGVSNIAYLAERPRWDLIYCNSVSGSYAASNRSTKKTSYPDLARMLTKRLPSP
jgi:hypothetical protein